MQVVRIVFGCFHTHFKTEKLNRDSILTEQYCVFPTGSRSVGEIPYLSQTPHTNSEPTSNRPRRLKARIVKLCHLPWSRVERQKCELILASRLAGGNITECRQKDQIQHRHTQKNKQGTEVVSGAPLRSKSGHVVTLVPSAPAVESGSCEVIFTLWRKIDAVNREVPRAPSNQSQISKRESSGD